MGNLKPETHYSSIPMNWNVAAHRRFDLAQRAMFLIME